MALKSADLSTGFEVQIAGLGGTGGTNPNHRPVLSDSMPIVGRCYSYPTICAKSKGKGGCGGDNGGPVFYWDGEQCDASKWPKSRSCAISKGVGHKVGMHTFVNGSDTWCSSADGVRRLDLQEAMAECIHGSFQHFRGPCVGLVFNGPLPGDQGSPYGEHTNMLEVSREWQGLASSLEANAGQPGRRWLPG